MLFLLLSSMKTSYWELHLARSMHRSRYARRAYHTLHLSCSSWRGDHAWHSTLQEAQRKLFTSLKQANMHMLSAQRNEYTVPKAGVGITNLRNDTSSGMPKHFDDPSSMAEHARLQAALATSQTEVESLRQECSRMAQNAAEGQRDFIIKLGESQACELCSCTM
jgi:hypothetical protein